MSNFIQKLISEGEHQQLDFKFEISDSRKIARTLVAFANTDGGRLLIGVKDNGSIAGIRSEEEFYMIDAASNLYTKPVVPFKYHSWQIFGKTILEIIVEKSNTRPHFVVEEQGKNIAFFRYADQNIKANRVLLKFWQRQQYKSNVYVRFTKPENILLQFLKNNNYITSRKFSRLAKIKLPVAENIIVNFLLFEILKVDVFKEHPVFCLADNHSINENKK